jgi:hypothetical protein
MGAKLPFLITTGDSCQVIIDIYKKGLLERDVATLVLSSKELYDVVLQYEDIIFDFQFGKKKFSNFGVTYN